MANLVKLSMGTLDNIEKSLKNNKFATGELVFGKYTIPTNDAFRPKAGSTSAKLYYVEYVNSSPTLVPIMSESDYADKAEHAHQADMADTDVNGNSLDVTNFLGSDSNLDGHTLTLYDGTGAQISQYTTIDTYPTNLTYGQIPYSSQNSTSKGLTLTMSIGRSAGAAVPSITTNLPAASNIESGIVTAISQTFGGVKTFADETVSENRDTGAVTIYGGLGVGQQVNAESYGVNDVLTMAYNSTEESIVFSWR